MVKNPPAYTGDIRAAGSIPVLGRSLREVNDNTFQHSCLKNPMDRRAWQAGYGPQAHIESDMTEAI